MLRNAVQAGSRSESHSTHPTFSLGVGQLLFDAAQILRLGFNNLATALDWKNLFHHLVEVSNLRIRKERMEFLFGEELVNATVLLFQALSPVRFAVVDGQSRLVSTSHFARGVVPSPLQPCRPPLPIPLLPIRFLTQDGATVPYWLACPQRGAPGGCTLILPAGHGHGDGDSGGRLLCSLLAISRDLHNLNEMVASATLSDAIRYMVLSSTRHCVPYPATMSDVPSWGKRILRTVICDVCSFSSSLSCRLFDIPRSLSAARRTASQSPAGDLSADDPSDLLFSFLHGNRVRKIFPNPVTILGKPSTPHEGFMVTLVLGAVLADPASSLLLTECINGNWKVPIVSPEQVGGIAAADLHPGTYVGSCSLAGVSEPNSTSPWFDSPHYRLYMVGDCFFFLLALLFLSDAGWFPPG